MKRVQVNKSTERRNYFRIDDFVILHYRIISDEELGKDQHAEDRLMIDKLTLKARFDSISRELQPLFRVIQAASPEIAQYLSSIDKKLNILSEYYVDNAMGDMDMSPQKVNIGAGGLCFLSPSPLMSGTILEMRVVLLPEHYGLFTYARVVSCVRNSDDTDRSNPYKISVQYIHMSDEVRDTITRHVLTRERQSIGEA
ncbi:MAG: PilZ domain-containing protein [Gammaproteobacteria bacterium]